MKFTDLQKYKHDTIGKFQILAELLEDITEENMKSAESLEILKAADEVFANMSESSKKFLKVLDQ